MSGIHAWSIALVVFVSILAGQALRLGQQGSVQVPVSALLVLVLGATTGGYALDRVVDTAIGAACGILVNLVVVPPTRLEDARVAVADFGRALADLLRQVADDLGTPGRELSAHLSPARGLGVKVTAADQAVSRTATALRWHPAGRRDRPEVEKLVGATKAAILVERPARGIARALGVADEGGAWTARVTSPGHGDQTGPDAPGSGTAELYHRALLAARAPEVQPETAAIVSAIALDAQRISGELRGDIDAPPPAPFNWRSLFA